MVPPFSEADSLRGRPGPRRDDDNDNSAVKLRLVGLPDATFWVDGPDPRRRRTTGLGCFWSGVMLDLLASSAKVHFMRLRLGTLSSTQAAWSCSWVHFVLIKKNEVRHPFKKRAYDSYCLIHAPKTTYRELKLFVPPLTVSLRRLAQMVAHGQSHFPRDDTGISLDFKGRFVTMKKVNQMFLAQVFGGVRPGGALGLTWIKNAGRPVAVARAAVAPNNVVEAAGEFRRQCVDEDIQLVWFLIGLTLGTVPVVFGDGLERWGATVNVVLGVAAFAQQQIGVVIVLAANFATSVFRGHGGTTKIVLWQ